MFEFLNKKNQLIDSLYEEIANYEKALKLHKSNEDILKSSLLQERAKTSECESLLKEYHSIENAIKQKQTELTSVASELKEKSTELVTLHNNINEASLELAGIDKDIDIQYLYHIADKPQRKYTSELVETAKENLDIAKENFKDCLNDYDVIDGYFTDPTIEILGYSYDSAFGNIVALDEKLFNKHYKFTDNLSTDFKHLLASAFVNSSMRAIEKMKANGAERTRTFVKNRKAYFNKIGQKYGFSIDNAIMSALFDLIDYQEDYSQAVELEKEEKRRQKEILKEEQKLEEELNKEEKEIKQQLSKSQTDEEREKLEEKLDDIEYRRSNTRAGYVYFVSNPDMKDGLIKIGVTRRTVEQRMSELSDASHAFKFNIHGYIFVDDCFELESKLHRYFADRRFNQLSTHKEHFFCTCEEIEEALKSFGYNVKLIKNPENEAYDASKEILTKMENKNA